MSSPSRAAGRGLTRTVGHALARHAATRYTAGPDVRDAIRAAGEAARHGARATIGAWTAPGTSEEEAADRHLDAVRAVRDAPLDAVVAVKSGAMGHRPDLLALVVARALVSDVELCFDAHDPASCDATLDAAGDALAAGHPAVGVALPSRWARSTQDARAARARGQAVRLVKGQWPDDDPGAPAPGPGMLRLADELAGHDRPVRVATHDAGLAAAALVRLCAGRGPAELELLLGLPLRAPAAAARRLGVPVRLYVPFGTADVPYDASAARRSPAIALRLARDAARRPRGGHH